MMGKPGRATTGEQCTFVHVEKGVPSRGARGKMHPTRKTVFKKCPFLRVKQAQPGTMVHSWAKGARAGFLFPSAQGGEDRVRRGLVSGRRHWSPQWGQSPVAPRSLTLLLPFSPVWASVGGRGTDPPCTAAAAAPAAPAGPRERARRQAAGSDRAQALRVQGDQGAPPP